MESECGREQIIEVGSQIGSITCKFRTNPAPEKAVFRGNRYEYDTNIVDYEDNLKTKGWVASLELVGCTSIVSKYKD